MFMGKSAVLSKASFGVTIGFVMAAMLQATSACAGDTVYYYSSDTVHSEVVVTDQNRNVVERTYYAPYGQVLNRDLRDGPGYGGHEEDPETGLVYMQQRYYCPECGRFLSVDPVDVDPTSGGNFNRYEYANDNPYRFTDPDGRESGAGYATGEYNIQFTPQDYANMNSAAGDLLGAVGDFMNAMPPETGGPELHGVTVMAAGAIRELAAGAKIAKAAKETEEGAAAVERAKNIAKGIPEGRLGPSGKPMVHTVEHSTRKAAREAAEKEVPAGGKTRFDAHPQDGQKPHFQAEDAQGNNVKPVVHHCVPDKSC